MTVAVAVEVVAVAPTREAMDEEDYTLFLSHTQLVCAFCENKMGGWGLRG